MQLGPPVDYVADRLVVARRDRLVLARRLVLPEPHRDRLARREVLLLVLASRREVSRGLGHRSVPLHGGSSCHRASAIIPASRVEVGKPDAVGGWSSFPIVGA